MAPSTRALLVALFVFAGCREKPKPIQPEVAVAPVVFDAGAPAPAPVVAPAPAPAVVAQVLQTIVIDLSGGAEVQRAGTNEWVALKIGDAIKVGDAVRTSSDGDVSLGFGKAQLHVQEGSELRLKILDARVLRAEVNGQVEADSPDDSSLQMEGPGGSLATVKFGRAVMHAEGDEGQLAVLAGKAVLHNGDSDVDLAAGGLGALRGKAVRKEKAPRRAALEVSWPEQKLTNKPTVTLKGRGGRWTRVFVQGQKVKQDDDGNFTSDVHLHRGEQRVRVVAIDVVGHRTVKSELFTLDPDAPNINAEVQFR